MLKSKPKVPQTAVFQRYTAWWFYNQKGQMVGPFKSKATALKQLENYLRYKDEANKIKNK